MDINYILISAVKILIAINHIQNKTFCLHNMFVCTVYIYYVNINAHAYNIYLQNIYRYIHLHIILYLYYI